MATSSNPKAQIEAKMDTSGVRPGFDQIKQDAKGVGEALKDAGQVGDRALKTIGDGAKASADVTSRAAGSMAAAITRATNQLQLAGKSASEALSLKIEQKGLDPARFQPAIAKLREAEAAAKAFQDQLRADDAARAAASNQQQFIAGLREQISLQGKSTDEVLRYRAARLGLGEVAAPLILQLKNQRDAELAAAQAAREEAAAQREATAAKQRAVSQQQAFIASLREQVDLQGKSQADVLRYRAAQLGVSDQANPLIAQLKALEGVQQGVSKSAAQMAQQHQIAAVQVKDFIEQVISGGSPLRAFAQQGAAVVSNYGGVGATLSALGSLITPVVVGIGALVGGLAGLAFGYKAGADEGQQFRQSIILTGNALGITSDRLGTMAARLGGLNGSQGKSAEVLDQFVNKGRVAADNLERFTAAAINMERATGPAVEATVQTFAQLAERPYEASVKLNQSINFLTASQLKQIKALQDAGNETQAARLAQEAYASALEQRAPQMLATLGLVERGWLGISNAVKGAWDAIKNVGRDDTLQQQLEKVQTAITAAQDKIAKAQSGELTKDKPFLDADRLVAGQRRVLVELEAQKANITEQIKLAGRAAEQDADRARTARLMAGWLNDEGKYLDKQTAAKREIAKIEEDGRVLVQKGLLTELQLQERVTAARARFADQGGDNELAGLNAKLKATNDFIAALGRQGSAARELNEGEKAAAQIREQLDKSRLTASERAEKQQALKVATELGQRQALAAALKADVDLNAKAADQAGQQADSIRQRAAEQEAANAVFGKGRTAIEQLTLAELKRQAADLEATDNVDPTYLANLNAKIQAQQALVAALQGADFKAINQGSQEWLRASAEALRLQSQEPAMLSLSAAVRERIIADRAVDLKLAKEIDEVEKSGLDTLQKKSEIDRLRTAASNDKARNELAASQQSLREINDFLDAGRVESFGAALAGAFDGAGNSLAKLSTALGEFGRQQQAVIKQQANASQIVDPAKRQVELQKLSERSQLNQVALYASMTGAAKGFFAEGSRGYKALEAAENAFRLVQLASDLQKGLSAAAVGIANQAQGDPYSAFPRMAAMAAAMAALGFAVGFTGGGPVANGDGGKRADGTGTVLGDSSAKSGSVDNSIKQLAETARLQLTTQSGMLASLRNIENSIGGLSALVVRGGTSAADAAAKFNVREGYSFGGAGGLVGAMFSPAIVARSLGLPQIGANLFGSKTTLTGNGLFAGSQLLGSVLTGGLNLQDYVDTQTKKKFFGITYSSSSGSSYSPADAQLAQQFTQVFRDLYTGVLQASTPLGQAFDQVKARLDGFVLNIGKIDLKGLTGEQIQEKLTAVIGAAADGIAQAAIPGLQEFQKVGQGYFETLVRVASGVETAKNDLDQLGIAAIAFSDVTRKQGDVATEIVRQSIAAFESSGGTLSTVGALINNLDGSADDLTSTYKALVQVRDALVGIGETGNSLTASLIQGAGGLDKLSSSLSAYLNGFFSDQERATAAQSTLAAQFSRIGISSLPQDRAGFRALVEGIDDSTEAGQRLKGQVLALAGAFDEAQQLIEKTKGAVGNLSSILASQASERDGLAVELLKAQGDTVGAAQLKRSQDLAKLTAGLSAAEADAATKGYDYIASLRAQIDALSSAAAEAQKAAQAEAARQSQRDGIQAQIDQLLGDTAAQRQRELAALDPANRALKESYYARLDAANAAEALLNKEKAVASERDGIQAQIDQLLGDTAAQRQRELAALDPANRALKESYYARLDEAAAAEAMLNKQKAVASEREAIQARIDQLQGNTAAIRQRELDALDPSNRALQEFYNTLVDQQKAASDAAAAAQAAAQAAEQVRQAWQSVTDGLVGEVQRIRGLTGANASGSLASAQAQFAITLAQARANDQNAAKQLPALSQAMLALAQQQATSGFELDLLRTKTAASLASVANQLAAQFGLSIPKLATGTNYVPRDMLALIHQGEAVVPKAFNPAAASGEGWREVVAAINALQADQRVQASVQARQARDLLQLQKSWDQNGLPKERKEVPAP